MNFYDADGNKIEVYGLKDMIKDISPYVLIPNEEIAKILKYAFQFILLNARNNKIVNISMFGQFFRKTKRTGKMYNYAERRVEDLGDRDILSYRPFPYVRWLLDPKFASKYYKYKQPWYYSFVEKLKVELYHHVEKYKLNDIAPPFYDDKIKERYEFIMKKKKRTLFWCRQ